MKRIFVAAIVAGLLLTVGCKPDPSEEDVRKWVLNQWPASSEQKILETFKQAGFQVSFSAKESKFYALLPVRSHMPFVDRAILVQVKVNAAWKIEDLKVFTESSSL